jgi:SAM-dependent methyltransferase
MNNNIDGKYVEAVQVNRLCGKASIPNRHGWKGNRHAYDQLAVVYHLMFSDWNELIVRQAEALKVIIEHEQGKSQATRILDPTCGIGSQILALALLGYVVTGCDISQVALERARREVCSRGLHIPLYEADVLNLTSIPESGFDVVVSLGNSLGCFSTFEELVLAITQMRIKLRCGGLLIAGVRDYDRALALRNGPLLVDPPLLCFDGGKRRIVLQVWEWLDGTHYIAHVYIDREGQKVLQHSVRCRAIGRKELTAALSAAGFTNIRWLPNRGQVRGNQSVYESGFDQLMVLADRPLEGQDVPEAVPYEPERE